MNILTLSLKHKYFDEILARKNTHEYREITLSNATKLGSKRVRMYQYDYRTESGALFACCAPTLEACRERRDKWLSSRQ